MINICPRCDSTNIHEYLAPIPVELGSIKTELQVPHMTCNYCNLTYTDYRTEEALNDFYLDNMVELTINNKKHIV